ncbi:MAG: GDSL-type esterase/lipase family protein [Bacteroidaceae bacterium]|nr:GDSL-type esterase/lipase family protein [Bacteroidaceae bacterium]
MKKYTLFVVALFISLSTLAQNEIKVACIGNSITYGHGIQDRDHDSYPAILGRLLGEGYIVKNFGVSGRVLLNHGDFPYMHEQAYQDALTFNPDVAIIKLGTNDSKPQNWKYKNEYQNDLIELIESFQKLDSHCTIYLCSPIPATSANWNINNDIIVNEIIPIIRKVARKKHIKLIDLYKIYQPYTHLLQDGIHPTEDGTAIIAYEISKVIKSK